MPKKPKERTLPQKIDDLRKQRDKIREERNKLSELETAFKAAEEQILTELREQGATKLSGKLATASVSESEVPSVEDWDDFYKFIRRNNAFYLLQRRPNAAPYRELMEQRRGKKIPGVNTVTTYRLNLTAIN